MNTSDTPFRFIDLFAGIGGFHVAMEELGGECVFASEIDTDARSVYRQAFPAFDNDVDGPGDLGDGQRLFNRNIRDITGSHDAPATDYYDQERIRRIRTHIPEHDVLCAGFPCQPFSKSGKQLGINETRGTLFHDILCILEARPPKFAILENVRNLAGPRQRDTWNEIVRQLRELHYRVHDKPAILSPHNLPDVAGGAPQVRDRVFILCEYVGPSGDVHGPLLIDQEPFAGEWDPRRDWDLLTSGVIADDLTAEERRAAELSDKEQGWLEAWQDFVQNITDVDGYKPDSIPSFPIWVDAFREPVDPDAPKWKRTFQRKNVEFYEAHQDFIDDWLPRLDGFPASRRKFEWQARSTQPTAADRDLTRLVYQFRPSGIRVKPATYLPALVAITQTPVLGANLAGGTPRRLIPREAAELQGLGSNHPISRGQPESDWSKSYKQLGNAVNVGAVTYVAEALFDGLWASRSAAA